MGRYRVIAIDSSAVIAIMRAEPMGPALAKKLAAEPAGERLLSTASYLEIGAVLAGGSDVPLEAIEDLDDFLENSDVALVPVDEEQARIALRARIVYGRGFGAAAGLNFGDCFSYALAKIKSAPLLYVGSDFDKTDIESA